MIEAPTNEIAIGMKSKDLGIDSCLMRSSMIASNKPRAAVKIGTTRIHKMVLTMIVLMLGSCVIQ